MSFLYVSTLTLALGAAVLALTAVVLMVRMVPKKGSKKKELLKPLPGPRGLPLIGSCHIVGRFSKPWDAFSALRKEYGDIFGLTLGSCRFVVLSDMLLIKEVLINKGDDFANRPRFLRHDAIYMGDRNFSIAFCNWTEKQKTRRNTSYPFLHSRLSSHDGSRMNAIIQSELQGLVSSLSQSQNQALDARFILNKTLANIFYQFFCSKRYSYNDSDFQKVVLNYDIVFRKLLQGFAADFLPWLKIFNESRLKELKNLAEIVWKVIDDVFEEHEENIDHNNPRDVVDLYLSYIKNDVANDASSLTLADAKAVIAEFVGAYAPTSNMWLWGLYLVAANPEVGTKIREEVHRVSGVNNAPSLQNREYMPYTEAVVLEILRIVISPYIPHMAVKDTSINGYEVPKDTIIMFNTYDLNMDPSLWTEPRKFLPQRFLNSSGTVSKPAHFIPFGIGKRFCLGNGFVKKTLFLGLATLLQNFEITLPEGFPKPDMQDIPGLMVPRKEILLVFKRLHQE